MSARVSPEAVHLWPARLRRPWQADEDALVMRLRADGATLGEIAARVERNVHAVRRRLQTLAARGKVSLSDVPRTYVDREPCRWCGVRGDLGCAHSRRVGG